MKKLIRVFAAACVAAVMVSCSKDDKKPENPVLESLAGTEWNFDLTFEMSSAEALGSLMEDSETGELVPVMRELRGQGRYSFKYPAVTLYACDMEPVKYEAPTKGAPGEEETVALMLSEDGQRLLFDEATEKLLKDNFLAGMDDDVTLVSDLWFKKAGKVL